MIDLPSYTVTYPAHRLRPDAVDRCREAEEQWQVDEHESLHVVREHLADQGDEDAQPRLSAARCKRQVHHGLRSRRGFGDRADSSRP